jgi:hypothetical protein
MSDDGAKTPWTIKGVPAATRQKVVACCAKQGQTQAEWIARAVDHLANLEAGERVIPPAGQTPADQQGKTEANPGPGMSLDSLAQAATAAQKMAEASGMPIPKTTARRVFMLLDNHCRVAQGLPVRRISARSPGSKTPMIEHDATDE